MHPFELWWIIEHATESQVYGNGMTHKQVRELYEETYGNGDG